MRVHLLLAVVVALVVVTVPLYLWRRPRGAPAVPTPDAGALADLAEGGAADSGGASMAGDAGGASGVSLADARTVRCVGERNVKVPVERCERLPFFEGALSQAIRDNVACAPITATGGTVSFVLTIDFQLKKTHLWPGQSGTIKRRDARDPVRCVKRALPAPDWSTIAHQYRRYDVAVLATYPPSSPLAPPGSPVR